MTSRYSVINAPAKDPGVCYITRTSVGPFIDTGIDMSTKVIDRGRLYLAVDVIREMAQLAGLFDEAKPVSVELQEKEWYDRGYNEAIKELKNDVVNNFVERVLIDSTNTAGAAVPLAPKSNRESAGAAVPGSSDTAAGEPQDGSNVGEVERESASTDRVKRSAGVSTNSSDESNFRL